MKILVIGGTGLIGSKVVEILRNKRHDVVAAAPSTGVNTITGEGLDAALAGTEVVVDTANSPSFEDKAAMDFFKIAGMNLAAAEVRAGVRHHLALSVVGTDRLQGSGYFRAKQVQEALIRASSVPYTIIHATQFFEFLRGIAQSGANGERIHLPTALFQPMAAFDVAAAVADAALGPPVNGVVEVAGPEAYRLDELVSRVLAFDKDPRNVIASSEAPYFGVKLNDASLMPGVQARLGATHFDWWLTHVPPPARSGI